MCVNGGPSLHTSHRQLKQWAREITAAEPSFDAQKPLLVSPTIRNLKVNKMLVDGGAGLNLISPVVIKRLQFQMETSRKRVRFKGSTWEGANRRRRSLCP